MSWYAYVIYNLYTRQVEAVYTTKYAATYWMKKNGTPDMEVQRWLKDKYRGLVDRGEFEG